MTSPPLRIGLLGGSFDPPHLAHVALARAALAQLGLDEVRWLPAGDPWQKRQAGRTLAPAADRAAMVRLAIEGEPRFSLDERELRRAGPSYTADTLRELRAECPGADWWLVIGQDQYAGLPTWHAWREVTALAGFAVASRDGRPVAAPAELAAVPHRCRVLALPGLPHSATDIRRLVAAGADPTPLVGAAVARYITSHSLYRETAVPPESHS